MRACDRIAQSANLQLSDFKKAGRSLGVSARADAQRFSGSDPKDVFLCKTRTVQHGETGGAQMEDMGR